MSWYRYKPYVPVAVQQAKAVAAMDELRKRGWKIHSVQVEGRNIASSFWGKQWCEHMESFHDFHNRLGRGRRYARNGSVCHLEIKTGKIQAIVSGSELYNVSVRIRPLKSKTWTRIVEKCRGKVGSMLELLQGKLSDEVMKVVIDPEDGLLPQPGEIHFDCDCPDWATMCKHVAAVLYGIGARLDKHPELLFLLRNVDAEELISAEVSLPTRDNDANALADDELSDIFGIDLDEGDVAAPEKTKKAPKRKSKAAWPKKRSKKTAKCASGKRKPGSKTKARKKTVKKRASSKKGGEKRDAPFRATGRSIATLRKKLDLSAKEFAEQIGVTPASVYRWESIRGKVNLQTRTFDGLNRLHQKSM